MRLAYRGKGRDAKGTGCVNASGGALLAIFAEVRKEKGAKSGFFLIDDEFMTGAR